MHGQMGVGWLHPSSWTSHPCMGHIQIQFLLLCFLPWTSWVFRHFWNFECKLQAGRECQDHLIHPSLYRWEVWVQSWGVIYQIPQQYGSSVRTLHCVARMLSHVQRFETLWSIAHQAPLSMDFLGKSTGAGCHFLLQGIFLTQGLNLCLLPWQVDSLPPRHLEISSVRTGTWLLWAFP